MASHVTSVVSTTAATHAAAPGAAEKHCVLSWLVSNPDQANHAVCSLLDDDGVIAGPITLPPGGHPVNILFPFAENPQLGSSRVLGIECGAGQSLKFQQTNASNVAGVTSTVVFETKPA